MRLAPRLALTFGALALISMGGAGLAVRYSLSANEAARFKTDVESICTRVVEEIQRQGEADQALIGGACQEGELVDRVAIALANGDLDERRMPFSQIVRTERKAFDLDELILAVDGGDIVGATPTSLIGLPSRDVDALLSGDDQRYAVRAGPVPALVSRCRKRTDKGRVVGLIGARQIDPLLDRLAKTLDVTVVPAWPRPPPPAEGGKLPLPTKGKAAPRPKATASVAPSAAPPPSASARPVPDGAELARMTCRFQDGSTTLTFDVLKSTRVLEENLRQVDQAVAVAAVISGFIAFVAAVFLARSLSRPLSVLAGEAGKVAAGEARPLRVRGSGEVQELATAFDRMIEDLASTRRRLAAASRVAAWREVARRVAHEVKNPLAPIRAAVETLRRLRAREDPRFDEYFDEATRTVLDEVHRISNIVTEFTRFARLPQPRPQDVDVEELGRHVVQLHAAAAGDIRLSHAPRRKAPSLRADRDQIIQVLTNLVQNALDSAKGVQGGAVTLETDSDGQFVAFSVKDNGPGIAPEIAARLFEPYATTKTNGTGLGLAIAQRIAIEHNGELSYIGPGDGGRGAVFRLVVPVEGPPPMSDVPSSDG